jgi:hypothetical protein
MLEDTRGRVREGLESQLPSWKRLRREGEKLGLALERHTLWEERHLVPVLRDADAWGVQRVQRLRQEHAEQRRILSLLLERLRDERRSPRCIAGDLLELGSRLECEMQREEQEALSPDIIRDDVVSIDLEAG